MIPVSSSLASASFFLSFTFTRTSDSVEAAPGRTSDALFELKYLLNAVNGMATIESQLKRPRNVPCRAFTPITLKFCPLIRTVLSIGLSDGNNASATS